jgi:ribosomal protein S18 acetylase RimI-like enzyme
MIIRPFVDDDTDQIIHLIAEFRVSLAQLKSLERELNLEIAKEELDGYRKKQYPIFIAEINSQIVGYIVCRTDEDVVWGESLFVSPNHRRQGIASTFYLEAEKLVANLGSDTVYNWIHPNNHAIIAFLKKRGYTVLNLIEVRKARTGEDPKEKIQVGMHNFDY